MRQLLLATGLFIVLCGQGCRHVGLAESGQGDGGADPAPITGVDVLVMVESGMSPLEWQPILGPQLARLVNDLTLPVGGEPVADDLRIAIATADMGLSWADHPADEYFPDLVEGIACGGFGEDGAFRTSPNYANELDFEGVDVPCVPGAGDLGCPEGWSCVVAEDDSPVCVAPPDSGWIAGCPGGWGGDVAWGATSPGAPNGGLGLAAGCVAQVGQGCGWKQQLRSIERALTREDQAAFVRDSAILAILAFTDDSECSIEDGPDLFESDEWSDGDAWEACEAQPEYLYSVSHFYDAFSALKGGRDEAMVFASLTGVPVVPACEGRGDAIAACLDRPEMQLVENGVDPPHYGVACESSSQDFMIQGWANRRFVELASSHFGDRAYVASLCRDDWSGAFDEIAALIGERMDLLQTD